MAMDQYPIENNDAAAKENAPNFWVPRKNGS
jgi:hypothetical protein